MNFSLLVDVVKVMREIASSWDAFLDRFEAFIDVIGGSGLFIIKGG